MYIFLYVLGILGEWITFIMNLQRVLENKLIVESLNIVLNPVKISWFNEYD